MSNPKKGHVMFPESNSPSDLQASELKQEDLDLALNPLSREFNENLKNED